MSDPMADSSLVWGELFAGVLRVGPRLDHRFGKCPCCDLGASDAADVGGVTWSYCLSCLVRWPVLDTPLARLDPQSDEFNSLFIQALSMCIELEPLPEGITPPALPVMATIREEPV
jgi:hypothetical protein